ncbi:MAG: hypothetical protein NZ932_00730 [Candidatus Bathyarchaeota archaeon]|nr:hypothetical protein [Candidatus Bathyarchaeota archaeon]
MNIGSLVTPVFVKGRVRRVREVESFEVDVDERKCWYCSGEAVGLFRYLPRGEVYLLCKRCSGELLGSGKWGVVESE